MCLGPKLIEPGFRNLWKNLRICHLWGILCELHHYSLAKQKMAEFSPARKRFRFIFTTHRDRECYRSWSSCSAHRRIPLILSLVFKHCFIIHGITMLQKFNVNVMAWSYSSVFCWIILWIWSKLIQFDNLYFQFGQ